MPLTPEDVVRKSFRSRMRGYDPAEVDAFLEEVVFELRRAEAEVDELKAKLLIQGAPQQGRRLLDIEQGQVDLIRQERASLVADIEALQARYEGLRAEVHDMEEQNAT